MMTSNEIRSRFLSFFRDNGHTVVPSSSLIPANDPTLLFINAGMVQFKDVFLGRDRRSYVRATTSQRCVRAGGKHNDLENVGYTARHHTFFEMLGNFSFGDYFKREAIQFAWRFLTVELGLAPDKLWVTVFEQDSEAEAVWIDEIGVDPNRVSRIGAKDNFWSMGDTGPCGPCSEIFYDHGEGVAGGPPGSADEDGDRYIEIWNLVFMQYDRQANGELEPLPKPSVDTGMGLERIAAVLQGVHDNYDIDLFRHLIKAAARITGASDLNANSLKVIADHIRATAFLIADGIMPGNEGRGYVLRRIMRRAVRHGYKLGCTQPFLYKLLVPLSEEMGQAYPELCSGQQLIERVILQEEERFAQTLTQGMRILDQSITRLDGNTIPGETAFLLYDTYGFPVDLTADVARERGLTVDLEGFEQHMQAQRERARAASQFGDGYSPSVEVDATSRFTGYDRTHDQGHVVALVRDGQRVQSLEAGQHALVILDQTPFYAEAGGQIGDQGTLAAGDALFAVADTQSQSGTAIAHWGTLQQGVLHEGDQVDARVDEPRRLAIMRNHSATHLLHAALRKVLGEHVTQKGSLVAPERLRFDFSHFEPVSWQLQGEIEQLVNQQILSNLDAQIRLTSYHEAIDSGAVALFGEKYGDEVRMLDFGGFSTELCGGTHVRRTGDIGLFKITDEQGIAAGVRRIEAVSGEGALHWINANEAQLREIAAQVRGSRNDVLDRVRQTVERTRALEKQVEQLKGRLAARQGVELAEQAREVTGVRVLAADLQGADARTLRDTADQLKNKLGSGIVVLGGADAGKVALVAGVTADLTPRIKAGELVNFVASQVGGRGGGRPDMAQAGGNRPERLPAALNSVEEWVAERLAAADA